MPPAARGYLLAAVALGLAAAALILAQVGLLATVLAIAVRGGGMAAVQVQVLLLLAVVAGRVVDFRCPARAARNRKLRPLSSAS